MAPPIVPDRPLPDPRRILFALPQERLVPLRRDWLRRNMRSWRWWLGVSLLCLLPFAGLAASERFVLSRVAAPSPNLRSIILGGGALCGCAVGLLALQLLADRIAVRNLRAALAAGELCLHCGYDLAGNVGGVCPKCGAAR